MKLTVHTLGITNWERPELLYGLFALFLVVFGYLLYFRWKTRLQRRFGSPATLERLAPKLSRSKSILKGAFTLLAMASLIMALANFREGTRVEKVRRQGIDIVFAVDVSRSMLTEDIQPNRLEKAKRLVSEILKSLAGDRIGIIAYAGQAYPQLPITTDYGSGRMFLQSMSTEMLSSQGTAIGAAIELASTYFDRDSQTNRVLVILSDGENHENEYLEEALTVAKSNGVQVFTIGIGTVKGGPIPEVTRSGRSLKKDENGETVISRLDPDELLEIARKGNGAYIDGTITEQAVETLINYLDQIEKREYEFEEEITEYADKFQWFLGAAFLFLLLDVLTLDRKTSWFERLNLFNEKQNGDE